MIYILHYLEDPKPWECWYIPYDGSCRMYIIICRSKGTLGDIDPLHKLPFKRVMSGG